MTSIAYCSQTVYNVKENNTFNNTWRNISQKNNTNKRKTSTSIYNE